ncbi:MAG: glycosyltransferase, partial [Chitinophagaceae bacterium]
MTSRSIILSHSGKQHSYYVAKALLDLGYLKQFVTSSYVSSPLLQKLIQVSKLTYLTRRFHQGLNAPYVDANWRYELKEQVMRMLKGNTPAVNNLVIDRDVSFDRALSKRLRRLNFETFWGFQGSCLRCLQTANQMNKETVCEMTSVYLPTAKAILQEEARLNPEWADSIVFSSFPSAYEARLVEEPQIAKHVIAISQFLKTTLIEGGIDEKRISVVPLGFDASAIKFNSTTLSLRDRPLRLLFVGRITQGKGIKYLLEAMKEFDKRDVELHIIGNIYGSGEALSSYKKQYTYSPGVSQQTLFSLYGNYDVLVLPSILEGFGLV